MNKPYLNVEDFILQRDRMKLTDEIIMVDESTAISESIVSPEWPLFKNGHVHSIVIIELVAQTSGINIKWNEENTPLQKNGNGRGFLMGIKKAAVKMNDIPVGSTIRTRAGKNTARLNMPNLQVL